MGAGGDLVVQGLSKLYAGSTGGVSEASFTLPAGTFFTLLGPSGCGKTTTLRCIAGLETPDRGAIRVGGTTFFDAASGRNVPLNRRNIAMVFQSYAIWPHLTVFENVAFPLRVGRERVASEEIRTAVARALAAVDLTGFERRSATQLSGGQQQRVALARAIVKTPSLLLLDEPLSNLDALLRDEMRVELKALQRRLGVTTIYVTHDQAEALEMSDVVAVMNKGRVVQMGPPQDVYFRPARGFVATFMGATNTLPGSVEAAVGAGGSGAVMLAGGKRLVCRFEQAAAAGARVIVSVRPEDVAVAASATPRGDVNRFAGRVVGAGFLGHHTRADIDIGGLVLRASAPSRGAPAAGADVVAEFEFARTLALPDDDAPPPDTPPDTRGKAG